MPPRITYHLTAQDEFRCLAGDCPASCCSGWQIAVEAELVERWKALPDAADRARFPALVRSERHGDALQLFMTGREQPRCGLLTANGLCEAHARYGVGYTPQTCQDFPRMQEETDILRMESASPACPVIARRVVLDAGRQPLFARSPTEPPPAPGDPRDRLGLALTDLLEHLVQEHRFPIGVRLYWLAERVGTWYSDTAPGTDRLAALERLPEALGAQLETLESRRRDRTLRPDPVIAGSFWNTLFQLGHARGLLPLPGRADSALRAGLGGLPADRRRFYVAVHAEVLAGRDAAGLADQAWYPPAANRLLQLLLLNTGFPWQPSLGDWRLSFVHGVMLYALVQLRGWMTGGGSPVSAAAYAEALYHSGRAFGHNTVILEQIRANPALLDLDRYHATWLDL